MFPNLPSLPLQTTTPSGPSTGTVQSLLETVNRLKEKRNQNQIGTETHETQKRKIFNQYKLEMKRGTCMAIADFHFQETNHYLLII